MSLSFFSDIGDTEIWTTAELNAALKEVEKGLLSNARQILFYGQQVQFKSTSEMTKVAMLLREELTRRNSSTGKSGRIKRITFTTRDKGF